MVKKIAKKLLIILVIILLIFVCRRLFHAMKENKTQKAMGESADLFYNTELFAEGDEIWNGKYANEPSDIQGWSKLDKKNAGLSVVNNSDTDLDGLSDKEEIEVYGSDPLKTSTAGDLYTDGYKVEHGLDLNTYYEDSEVTFAYNIPKEVTLIPASASDSEVSIREIKDKENSYIHYHLNDFSGSKIIVDVSSILEETGIKESKLACYIYELKDANNNYDIDYSVKDGSMEINYEFDPQDSYDIYITNIKVIPSKIENMLFGDDIAEDFRKRAAAGDFIIYKGYYANSEEGVIVMPLLITYIFNGGIRPIAVYNKTDDESVNASSISKLIEIARHDSAYDDIDVRIKARNIVEVVTLYEKLESILDGFFNGKHDSVLHNAFFSYRLLSEYEASHPKEKEAETYSGNCGLDIVDDTLPFSNFKSTIGKHGNCVGIATLISKIYNTKSNPSSGECISNNELKWDISIDKANNTLTDEILDDYKNEKFVENHKNMQGLLNENLSEGEIEFVKMIGAYFIDGNNAALRECNRVTDRDKGYYLENLRKVCHTYLNDKTLILCMFYVDEEGITHGHAVNIYGYDDNTEMGGNLTIDVYDNNLEGAKSEGLKVVVTPRENGTFDYEYSCSGEKSFRYTSDSNNYMFVIMDEDQNILFGTDQDVNHKLIPINE